MNCISLKSMQYDELVLFFPRNLASGPYDVWVRHCLVPVRSVGHVVFGIGYLYLNCEQGLIVLDLVTKGSYILRTRLDVLGMY